MLSSCTTFALAIALANSSTSAPQRTTIKVRIADGTYRVTVKGKEVEVANKSAFTHRGIESREVLRDAVTKATNCRILDDYWEGAKLVGRLECSNAQ